MKKKILLLLISFTLFSCGIIGDRVDLFEKVDFNEKADWLFVKTNTDYDTCEIIYDQKILHQIHDDLLLKSTRECGGTTPDNCLGLYKNGKRIRSFCYCSWESMSFYFGRLKSKFTPAELKIMSANSIVRHDVILDSLRSVENIYLLYPKDTTIVFPSQLQFDLMLNDTGQDIFEQEKPIEENFKQVFKQGNYSVKADWYSSQAGKPRKLGYHVTVDCDSSFLALYHSSNLVENKLFREMTNGKYLIKEFEIKYYQWKK